MPDFIRENLPLLIFLLLVILRVLGTSGRRQRRSPPPQPARPAPATPREEPLTWRGLIRQLQGEESPEPVQIKAPQVRKPPEPRQVAPAPAPVALAQVRRRPRLRDMIVWQEILNPPLARRRR